MTAKQVEAGPDAVEAYVVSLGSALRGPRRARADLLREARDHLTDATEALVEGGLSEPEAQRRAVAQFGAVEEVAPAYQAVLSSGSGQRVGFGLFVVTAAQPVVWDLAVGRDGDPTGTIAALLSTGVEVVGIVALVVAPMLVVLGGRGVRRLGVRVGLVRWGVGCTLGLSVLIALLAVGMVSASHASLVTGLALAGGIAIVPFGVVAVASVRCLRALTRAQDLGRPRLRP